MEIHTVSLAMPVVLIKEELEHLLQKPFNTVTIITLQPLDSVPGTSCLGSQPTVSLSAVHTNGGSGY